MGWPCKMKSWETLLIIHTSHLRNHRNNMSTGGEAGERHGESVVLGVVRASRARDMTLSQAQRVR